MPLFSKFGKLAAKSAGNYKSEKVQSNKQQDHKNRSTPLITVQSVSSALFFAGYQKKNPENNTSSYHHILQNQHPLRKRCAHQIYIFGARTEAAVHTTITAVNATKIYKKPLEAFCHPFW